VDDLCQEQYKSKAFSLPGLIKYHITSSRTMRFAFVLAVIAALTVSVSANTAESDTCPFFCKHTSDCAICEYETHCVSISLCSMRFTDEHFANTDGRSSFYASQLSVACPI
jgi:hypothetical protein